MDFFLGIFPFRKKKNQKSFFLIFSTVFWMFKTFCSSHTHIVLCPMYPLYRLVCGLLFVLSAESGSGINIVLSTAFGITEIFVGSVILALKTVFSRLVCETQMHASQLVSVYSRSLLVRIELVSANPNKE